MALRKHVMVFQQPQRPQQRSVLGHAAPPPSAYVVLNDQENSTQVAADEHKSARSSRDDEGTASTRTSLFSSHSLTTKSATSSDPVMVQDKDAARDTTTTSEPVYFQKLQRDMAELQKALHQQHLAHQDQLMVLQKQNQILEDDMVTLMESMEKHRQAAQLQVLALTEQNMQHKSYMIRLEQRQQATLDKIQGLLMENKQQQHAEQHLPANNDNAAVEAMRQEHYATRQTMEALVKQQNKQQETFMAQFEQRQEAALDQMHALVIAEKKSEQQQQNHRGHDRIPINTTVRLEHQMTRQKLESLHSETLENQKELTSAIVAVLSNNKDNENSKKQESTTNDGSKHHTMAELAVRKENHAMFQKLELLVQQVAVLVEVVTKKAKDDNNNNKDSTNNNDGGLASLENEDQNDNHDDIDYNDDNSFKDIDAGVDDDSTMNDLHLPSLSSLLQNGNKNMKQEQLLRRELLQQQQQKMQSLVARHEARNHNHQRKMSTTTPTQREPLQGMNSNNALATKNDHEKVTMTAMAVSAVSYHIKHPMTLSFESLKQQQHDQKYQEDMPTYRCPAAAGGQMKESSFADTEQDNNADMSLEYDMDEKVLDISALHDENDAATLENLDELIQQLNDESFIEPGLVQSEECSFWTALWDNSDLYNGVEEEILLSVVSSDDISDDEQEQQEYENDWAANDNHELSILSEIDSAEEMAELNLSKIWDSEHHPLALHGRLLEPSVQASFQFLPRTADSGCFNDAQTGQHQPEQENQELKWDGELHPMALCDGLAASFLSLARNSDTRHYDAQANQQKQVPQKHMVEWDGECHPMALCHGLNEQSLQGDCMSRARKGDLAKLLMLKQTNYNQSPRNKN